MKKYYEIRKEFFIFRHNHRFNLDIYQIIVLIFLCHHSVPPCPTFAVMLLPQLEVHCCCIIPRNTFNHGNKWKSNWTRSGKNEGCLKISHRNFSRCTMVVWYKWCCALLWNVRDFCDKRPDLWFCVVFWNLSRALQ